MQDCKLHTCGSLGQKMSVTTWPQEYEHILGEKKENSIFHMSFVTFYINSRLIRPRGMARVGT
jgi:hypothetical protein